MTQAPTELLVTKTHLFLSENSDIAIARPKMKKKKIEEERGSEKEGINIKLEQSLCLTMNLKINVKVISKSLFR